jgi:outer membrane protein assembly factor BamB
MKRLFYFVLIAINAFACKTQEDMVFTPQEPILVEPADTACIPCKDCKEGDGINGPICQWRTLIDDSKTLSANKKPKVFKHLAIFTREELGKPEAIMFYHKESGKKLGEWDAYADGAPNSLSHHSLYAYGNTLVVGTGTRVYGIDLQTFKTKWMSKSHDFGDWTVNGIGNTTFHFTMDNTQKTIYLEKGEVSSDKHEVIYQETVPNNVKVGYEYYHPYVEGKDTMLLFWVYKYNFDTYVLDWYTTSYNVTQKKLIYQEKINSFKNNGSFPDYPSIKDGKAYISAGVGLFCIDIKTGKEIWKTELPSHATEECVLGDDNRVYVASARVGASVLHCFDAVSGKELWTTQLDASTQNMIYHKDILYTISSNTTKIHAIDTKTQKILWKYITSENKNGGSNVYFVPTIQIDKPNNRLYVGSNTSAYCFKL